MNFSEQFAQLDQRLESTRQWWQFAAFHPMQSRWPNLAPELHQQLEKLRLGYPGFDEADGLELQPLLNDYIPELAGLKSLANVNRNELTAYAPDVHWQYQIAGRKWLQISRFVPHVPEQQHLLEWCAGKGHLGRLAASQGALSLTSVEWQANLCEKNQQLNERLALDSRYCVSKVVQRDVMSDELDALFQQQHFALALHACGDLHTHLVRQVVARDSAGLCLAPCCYHLTQAEQYRPLSSAGQASQLRLSKLDLSLPLRQLVTAGERERREQQQERLWRIAFDCWQRRVRGIDEYLPLPTIPKSILKSDFVDFIRWAADCKSLDPGASISPDVLLSQAEARLPAIAQMEWVQNQFQRPLEIWLLLDQVLYLERHGYQCELFEFCDRNDTPRNLMIKAVKGSRSNSCA